MNFKQEKEVEKIVVEGVRVIVHRAASARVDLDRWLFIHEDITTAVIRVYRTRNNIREVVGEYEL